MSLNTGGGQPLSIGSGIAQRTFDTARNIVALGDSLVAGQQDGVGYNWPEQLKAALGVGVTVVNHGRPAWTSTEVAILQGGVDVVTSGFTIPAGVSAATVPVTSPTTYLSPNTTVGITYKWLGAFAGIQGILQRNNVSGVWTFTRLVAGSSTVVAGGGVFHAVNGAPYGASTHVFLIGRNNYSATATIISDIDAMIATLTPGVTYLVLSILTASDETSGGTPHTQVTTTNAALATHYGVRYLDARRYMIDSGLAFNSLTPAGGDTTAINGDTIPPQLMMADLTHPNRYGTRAIAQAVLLKLIQMGWVTAAPAAIPSTAATNLWYSPGFEYAEFAVGGHANATNNLTYRTQDASRAVSGRADLWGLRTNFYATTSGTLQLVFAMPATFAVAKSSSIWVRSSKACVWMLQPAAYSGGGSSYVDADFSGSYTSVSANTWTKVSAASTFTVGGADTAFIILQSTTIWNAGDIVDFDDFAVVSGTSAP